MRHPRTSECGSLHVLLAHDDRLELFGLERALADDGVDVVGEAHTSDQVVPLLAKTHPDVLLISLDLLDGMGKALRERIYDRHAKTRTIVIGRSADVNRVLGDTGAAGFVSASVDPRHLPTVLREAVAGTFYLLPPQPRETAPRRVESLTGRELSVLRGAARGLSNDAIGRELWLSPHTVKSHLHRIYAKLDVANRTEAARWAIENRLADAESTAV